jgi:hypothetical protein
MVAVAVAACALGAAPAWAADVRVQGETMTLAPGTSGADTADAAATPSGRTLALFNNGAATKSVTLPQSTTHLLVRVRGDACVGAPAISVKVNGTERYAGPVSTAGYRAVGFRLSVPAGTHTVSVNMTNDHSVPAVCDRTVYVDDVYVVGQPFSPTGWRNAPLPANAPIALNSVAMVGDIIRQMEFPPQNSAGQTAPGVWITTTEGYSDPIYVVGRDEPTVDVEGRTSTGALIDMKGQWDDVPLPADAQPNIGREGHLALWQPETDTMWEFAVLRKENGKWIAQSGGRVQNVSTNEGMFGNPPGTKYGATASAITLIAGMPRIEELRRGVIDHAIVFAVANSQGRKGWCWPAYRTDHTHTRLDPAAIPAGARFRLRHDFNINAWHASNPMHSIGLMWARAIQKYGMVARDEGWGFGFWAEDPLPTGEDPYHGPGKLFDTHAPNAEANGVLKNFPWHELQALAQPADPSKGCTDRAP